MKDRFEFLEKLRQSLAGRIDSGTLQDTMNYYQEYFEIQVRSGKSEQEILEQLGDPRLLAKSILQAEQRSSTMEEAEYEEAPEEEENPSSLWTEADYNAPMACPHPGSDLPCFVRGGFLLCILAVTSYYTGSDGSLSDGTYFKRFIPMKIFE